MTRLKKEMKNYKSKKLGKYLVTKELAHTFYDNYEKERFFYIFVIERW